MIQIKKFTFNPVQENTFLLYDESKECIIIDAGCYFENEKKELDDFISSNELKPVKLVNTHCHFDHVLGITHCRSKYNIPFFAHEEDHFLIDRAVQSGEMFGVPVEPIDQPDGNLEEGEKVEFGNSTLEMIHVPGHAPGSIVFHSPDQKFIIAGDVLFYGSIGRTDLPKGDFDQLISNIKNKLLILPEDTTVCCGHGPETTIGFEKQNNPFLMD